MPDEIILVVFEPSDEDPTQCDCPACAFEREAEKLIKQLFSTSSKNNPELN